MKLQQHQLTWYKSFYNLRWFPGPTATASNPIKLPQNLVSFIQYYTKCEFERWNRPPYALTEHLDRWIVTWTVPGGVQVELSDRIKLGANEKSAKMDLINRYCCWIWAAFAVTHTNSIINFSLSFCQATLVLLICKVAKKLTKKSSSYRQIYNCCTDFLVSV